MRARLLEKTGGNSAAIRAFAFSGADSSVYTERVLTSYRRGLNEKQRQQRSMAFTA